MHGLAVTSELAAPGGRPTAWSAAFDALAYADGINGRLFVLSAGNLPRASIVAEEYPAANDLNPIQNPAQSWNSLTVGSASQSTRVYDLAQRFKFLIDTLASSWPGWGPREDMPALLAAYVKSRNS